MNPSDAEPKIASIPPFGLRLQPELKSKVEAAARANGRSLNSEIAARLDRSFRIADDAEGVGSAAALEKRIAALEQAVIGINCDERFDELGGRIRVLETWLK